MGTHPNIGAKKFPRQGDYLARRVVVMFNHDPSTQQGGVCVRDDFEAPGITIFRLDDGRYVLSTECQYS